MVTWLDLPEEIVRRIVERCVPASLFWLLLTSAQMRRTSMRVCCGERHSRCADVMLQSGPLRVAVCAWVTRSPDVALRYMTHHHWVRLVKEGHTCLLRWLWTNRDSSDVSTERRAETMCEIARRCGRRDILEWFVAGCHPRRQRRARNKGGGRRD